MSTQVVNDALAQLAKLSAQEGVNPLDISEAEDFANTCLHDFINDYIASECEEDSWEKAQDLDTWSFSELESYYTERWV